MAEALRPDICVIGGGSAGLSAAAAAAAFGVSVVLVEKGAMGGDCLNYGCVPSKALLAAARRAEMMRRGEPFGIAPVEPEVDFARVRAHLRGVIAAIAPNDSEQRFRDLGVTVIRAEARFTDARTVMAGGTLIRARRFVVAAGSSPLMPPLPGLQDVPFLTNETVFDLPRRPGHLAILGAGPVGIELAQAFRRLGSAVTVICPGAALGNEDPELAAVVLRRLRTEGVMLHEHMEVSRVESAPDGRIRLHADAGATEVVATHLLVATGRRANTAGLGLETAGIVCDEKGIRTAATLKTSNPRVYAVGDIAGGPQFTHAASYQASLAVRQILFRLPARQRPAIIPRVTYTDPELAHVGLSEAEAGRKVVKVLRWPLSRNDRAEAERETDGLIKIVAGRRGRILGVSIAASGAGEMIHPWALAIARNLTLRDMLAYVPPYPTVGEIGRRAALTGFEELAKSRALRLLIRFLRQFG